MHLHFERTCRGFILEDVKCKLRKVNECIKNVNVHVVLVKFISLALVLCPRTIRVLLLFSWVKLNIHGVVYALGGQGKFYSFGHLCACSNKPKWRCRSVNKVVRPTDNSRVPSSAIDT